MRRRWLLLIASILIASIGTALVAMYVNQADSRAQAGQQTVPVVVAVKQIEAGDTAAKADEDGAFQERTMVRDAVAPGAIRSVSAIRGQTATVRILPGEQILAAMFSRKAGQAALVPPNGKFAVTIQVDDPDRVAGYATPGSTVAVFASGENTPSHLVLQSALVMAVGLYPGSGTATPAPGTSNSPLVTLAVTQAEAQRVKDAAKTGQLWLALPGPNATAT